MSSSSINPRKIAILTGAGISAPSGLATFRDPNGLWERYRIEDVATPEAWLKNPALVLDFYNQRRAQAARAQPNEAHRALAALEDKFEVVVITQNIDDLHERAGSTRIIHLHGELDKARSTADPTLVQVLKGAPIHLGDVCLRGSQLRPDVVWFGEPVERLIEAADEIGSAGTVLVVGTSLSVFPAAGLIKQAHYHARKILIDLSPEISPRGFRTLHGSAEKILPSLVSQLIARVQTN